MRWFSKRRKDANMAADKAAVTGTGKHSTTTLPSATTKPDSTRGGVAREQAHRRPSTTRSRDRKPSTEKSARPGASVTNTNNSETTQRGRRQQRRHKLLYFERGSREDITALPGSRELNISPHLRPATRESGEPPYSAYGPSASYVSMANTQGGRSTRRSSIKRAADAAALPKRQSTKRRKDEHVREDEIRAMSGLPSSGRPRRATYDSGILRKDSKRGRGGLNLSFERPPSNVSLPGAESFHSSRSGGSDPFSYHLSRLEVFAPRPLIRQTVSGQYTSGLNASMWSARADSRASERRARRKLTPAKEIIRGGKTVNELANELDSSDLRAVMERDQRRKEQKRQKDLEKAQQRLERRAEKEKASDMGEKDSPSKRKRKDLDKHLGLGIDSPLLSEVETPKRKKKDFEKDLRRKPSKSKELSKPASRGDAAAARKDYFDYRKVLQEASSPPTPSAPSPRTVQEERIPAGTPLDEAILLNIHPAFRPSPGPIHSPTMDRAQAPIPAPVTTHDRLQEAVTSTGEEAESPSETIEALPPLPSSPTKDKSTARQSSLRSGKGWSSLFKRGPSLRKGQQEDLSANETSFSNVSRESVTRNLGSRASFAAVGTGPVLVPTRSMSQTNSDMYPVARTGSASTAATSRRNRSGTPVRTMSKFREDLPELPLALTTSQRDSPELDVSRSTSVAVGRSSLASPVDAELGNGRDSVGAEEGRGLTRLMSESLASVDSEASWLSGRPVHRPSVRRSARNSVIDSSASQSVDQGAHANGANLAVTSEKPPLIEEPVTHSDEKVTKDPATSWFESAITPIGTFEPGDLGDVSESAIEYDRSSIQQDEDLSLKTGDVGKTPKLIEQGLFAKSREGLLNDFKQNALEMKSDKAPEKTAAERSLPTPEPESERVTSFTGTMLSDESSVPPTSPFSDQETSFQRANSVKVFQSHAREISAGSVKLLDIPAQRRPSTSHGPGSTSSAPGSQSQTPRKGSAVPSPATEKANPVELTPPPTAIPVEKTAVDADNATATDSRIKSDSAAFV